VGVRKPAPCSIAGQNRPWKLMMSLPMKWCISAVLPGARKSSKLSPVLSHSALKLAR
jgi:hypothetical protein